MEKTYKVTMYNCQYPNHGFPGQLYKLYTSLELIDFVNNTLREKADTISDACRVINCSNGYIDEVIVEFTNEDFIGNIKPDGTMTQKLDLGAFTLEVPRSEDLVANFDKLSIEQLINEKAKDILNDFVHDMFISDDRPNTEAQIMNMRKFNGIDLETLFNFLVDTVTDMPVADLMSDDFGTLSMHTDEFWHKIVVETAHNS